ncbi:MAG: T9SS type A sorting domain-containing protein, partial [Saprospiraceae bacterium]|nr:T9SS type A sorting domain-containing protein [Saprospiraceae bacterium]
YPSPAKDKLFIRSENTVQGTPFGEGSSFEVFDLLGRNVLRGTLTTQKELNIAELAAGTYVLKVGSDVVKFVKE